MPATLTRLKSSSIRMAVSHHIKFSDFLFAERVLGPLGVKQIVARNTNIVRAGIFRLQVRGMVLQQSALVAGLDFP